MLLRSVTADSSRYETLVASTSPDQVAWWLPALVHLALARDDLSPEAHDELTAWCERRSEHSYAVVQEETDDHLSFTATSWPVVDPRGRLRFPTTEDPVELDIERDQLQVLVDAHRARWVELGLLTRDQASRPVALGDTFALDFEWPPGVRPASLRALRRVPPAPGGDTARALRVDFVLEPPAGDDPIQMDLVQHPVGWPTAAPPQTVSRVTGLVDITWDARQAGKIAHLAAFMGMLGEQQVAGRAVVEPATGDAELIQEGLDRQFRAYVAGLPPDAALTIDDQTDADPPPAGVDA